MSERRRFIARAGGLAATAAAVVDEMTGGTFKIEVFPTGQLMPVVAAEAAIVQREQASARGTQMDEDPMRA